MGCPALATAQRVYQVEFNASFEYFGGGVACIQKSLSHPRCNNFVVRVPSYSSLRCITFSVTSSSWTISSALNCKQAIVVFIWGIYTGRSTFGHLGIGNLAAVTLRGAFLSGIVYLLLGGLGKRAGSSVIHWVATLWVLVSLG